MAFDIAIGRKSHDLVFDASGDLILIDNAERVAQQIKITLLAWLGEWFLDLGFGTPYLRYILVKGANRAVIESVLRAQITAVPDVSKVTSMTLQVDDELRRLAVVFEAETAFGVVNNSVILNG
ncbi:MAG: hypothetical protein JWP29_3536 [Rhodoferax sp.]|nr:hypothetical protein [Rhodoferax sp.]